MKISQLIPAAALALATTAFAADRSFDRTLTVTAAPNVTVLTGSGTIHLVPGSDSQVHIAARLHASNGWFSGSGDVDSRMQNIVAHPPIAQQGNDITIGERHPGDLYRNISIDYDITLPRSSSIAATTGSGDVAIEGVGASLKAQSGSGSIHARGIQGPATLGSGSGDIELQQIASGDVKAETGSGSIRLSGVNAALKAGTGSGDIEVSGQPGSDWRLNTGSGSIRLNLGSSAHFTLDADTGSGTVHTAQAIAMQGDINHHHVHGTINGGGPTLRASTGSGDIDIR